MRVMILGATGQLGQSLMEAAKDSSRFQLLTLKREEAPFEDPERVITALSSAFEKMPFDWLVNAVAYNHVELAETHRVSALQINADTPQQIAAWCGRNHVRYFGFSSDFVFSGEGERPWSEQDLPKPICFYGKTKLLGERAVLSANPEARIWRVSWLFSPYRENFISRVRKLAEENETLNMVSDQVGAPTYAPDLARAILESLHFNNSGITHVCNSGYVSRYDFASKLIEECDSVLTRSWKLRKIYPISSGDLQGSAVRPLNSRLLTEKLERDFQIQLRPWPAALKECVSQWV